MTLALDPFQRVVHLHWGARPGALAVFAFDLMGMASHQASSIVTTVLSPEGQTLGYISPFADLLPWADGGMVGLEASPMAGTMRVFRTVDRRLPPVVSLASASLPLMSNARLWPLADGRIGVVGLESGTLCYIYAGSLAEGASLPRQSVPTTQAFDRTGIGIGSLMGIAGTPVLDNRLFLGCYTNALSGANASRVILGVEIVGTSLSRRLVEAAPRTAPDGITWAATATVAWGGRFWVVTTRFAPGNANQRHVLYAFSPGGEPDDGLDIGGVEEGVPWGLMVQAIQPEGEPDPHARWGGMWAGDRLVIGVVPSAFKTVPYTGVIRADGPAGVLVMESVSDDPVFRPTPSGFWLGGAHCLGPDTGRPGEAWWLCALIDAIGGTHMALTRDFQTWTLDPEGIQAVPAHLYTQSRWGAFRV